MGGGSMSASAWAFNILTQRIAPFQSGRRSADLLERRQPAGNDRPTLNMQNLMAIWHVTPRETIRWLPPASNDVPKQL
jgi:hypothetical protein